MPFFRLLLIDLGILIRVETDFLKFMQVEDALFTRLNHVKVDGLDSPKRLVLQFDGQMTWLAIDKLERSHANWGFVGHPVCPQCIIQSQTPVFSAQADGGLEDVLNLTVRDFNLATCLRVVWCCNFVFYPVLLHETCKGSVDEVRSSIANHHSRNTEPWKNHLLEKAFD